jgi:hypothetical protein
LGNLVCAGKTHTRRAVRLREIELSTYYNKTYEPQRGLAIDASAAAKKILTPRSCRGVLRALHAPLFWQLNHRLRFSWS